LVVKFNSSYVTIVEQTFNKLVIFFF